MRKILIAAAALAVPFMAAPASADGHMTAAAPELAKKDWYRIVVISFHQGKADEGMKLIEAFMAVDKALGRKGPMAFHMDTGAWDMLVAFKMDDGIASMGWKDDPADKAWNAELVRQLGGEEAARAHWAKYNAAVASSVVNIAHIDLD